MQCEKVVFPEKQQCRLQRFEMDLRMESGWVLVRNRISLISAGTELAMFNRTHRGFDVPDRAG